ncbi:unnamed protein product [Rotaria sordida]|uniref:Uncharacterized protein n=1 Tax=Rotaria sordida TaxID=392033 RepID=A0A820DBR1_9BILA|nr:unnamed protein product [Rotaria sordida]CAF4229471.1 unnamed protein product [Rotaria sordida]
MLNYESMVVALNDLIEEGDHRCIDARGESLDYAESQFLILLVIDQLQNERNETSFKSIYSVVLDFANRHDAFITNTMGHRNEFLTEADYRENICFPLIDVILVEMRDRFSPSNLAV